MKKMVFLTLTIFIFCGGVNLLQGQTIAGEKYPKPTAASLATVKIIAGSFDEARNFQRSNSGSGVIISPDGLIITVRHNLYANLKDSRQSPEVWVGLINSRSENLPPNRAYRARVIASDEALDLAVLKIVSGKPNEKFSYLKLGETSELYYGQILNLVGYAASNGTIVSKTQVSVVGLDETDDWLKIEGQLLQGISGGALVDEASRLIGIPVKAAASYSVPFFDENNEPVGQIALEQVGLVRTAETIRQFLRSVPNLVAISIPGDIRQSVEIFGAVVDKTTNQPVRYAAVGILVPDAANPAQYIGLSDLVAYGRTDERGAFKLNRRLKPGNYLVKIVHPNYKTEIRRIQLPNPAGQFFMELTRER